MAIMIPKRDEVPDARQLRWFGIGLLAFSAFFAATALAKSRRPGLAIAFGLLGVLVLAAPSAGRRIYGAWMALARPVGLCVSALLLAILYFCVLTPIGLLLRLCGRDALRLRTAPAQGGFWTELRLPADKNRYKRLF